MSRYVTTVDSADRPHVAYRHPVCGELGGARGTLDTAGPAAVGGLLGWRDWKERHRSSAPSWFDLLGCADV
ncbi:uncharacterized protein N7506_011773 [Penicillium brevicompactum]|uniref:uncharacterized protein n=1 Tax=Penicillium brevicompactum TaxID=5074 RepID=UPI00254141AC|nr:uncharacterized protein N7506_011773 [Penicillium brevicompactum]KAJ5319069.1 hypothetical protein N7506_011773 [Penicillium brevicompactum]